MPPFTWQFGFLDSSLQAAVSISNHCSFLLAADGFDLGRKNIFDSLLDFSETLHCGRGCRSEFGFVIWHSRILHLLSCMPRNMTSSCSFLSTLPAHDYPLWFNRLCSIFNWFLGLACLLCSPSLLSLNASFWILWNSLKSQSLLDICFQVQFSYCFTMSSHFASSSSTHSGPPNRSFVIDPNLSTAPPPPAFIDKGPFSIPLDPSPTRIRFSDPRCASSS